MQARIVSVQIVPDLRVLAFDFVASYAEVLRTRYAEPGIVFRLGARRLTSNPSAPLRRTGRLGNQTHWQETTSPVQFVPGMRGRPGPGAGFQVQVGSAGRGPRQGEREREEEEDGGGREREREEQQEQQEEQEEQEGPWEEGSLSDSGSEE
eukprot:2912514-Rhodomonas_salina.1